MKATINLQLSIGMAGDDNIKSVPLEVVCVFGKPTADPAATVSIPFRIKEMVLDGDLLDWPERQMILKCIGGEKRLMEMVCHER